MGRGRDERVLVVLFVGRRAHDELTHDESLNRDSPPCKIYLIYSVSMTTCVASYKIFMPFTDTIIITTITILVSGELLCSWFPLDCSLSKIPSSLLSWAVAATSNWTLARLLRASCKTRRGQSRLD